MLRKIPVSAVAAIVVAAIYALVLAWTIARGQNPTEYLFVLAIFAVVFPAASWLTTIGVRTPSPERPAGLAELGATLACTAVIAAMLVPGPSALADWVAPGLAPLAREAVIVVVKLALFVVLPAAVLIGGFGRRLGDFGLGRSAFSLPRAALVFGVTAALFTGVQFLFSTQSAPFRSGEYSVASLAIAGPITLIWMSIEAGFVEEFFFRAVLQERLAHVLRSPLAGALIGALVFGLAHAPGIVMREGGNWPDAITQCVLVLAPAGFAMGVLWMRTRSLRLLALIHGAGDFVPSFAHIGALFGLVAPR
jgi:uncharacterized protein